MFEQTWPWGILKGPPWPLAFLPRGLVFACMGTRGRQGLSTLRRVLPVGFPNQAAIGHSSKVTFSCRAVDGGRRGSSLAPLLSWGVSLLGTSSDLVLWGAAGAVALWAGRLEAVSPLSRAQRGSQARASRVGSPWGSPEPGSLLPRGRSCWSGGPGDPSLSLELTSESEGTSVKADAAAEPRTPGLEGVVASRPRPETSLWLRLAVSSPLRDGREESREWTRRTAAPSGLCARRGLPRLAACWPGLGGLSSRSLRPACLLTAGVCQVAVPQLPLRGGSRRLLLQAVSGRPGPRSTSAGCPWGGDVGLASGGLWLRPSNTQWGSDRGGT